MAVLGVNFTKLHLEKNGVIRGKVNIRNNIVPTNVERGELNVGTATQPLLKISFEFGVQYDPKVANILITGELLVLEKAERINELITGWQKNKTLPKDVMELVIPIIAQKANIEALLLSKEVNLPPPIRLPKITFK